MALDLHIAGPGLDVVRRIEPGQPELVLGRDADCDICLPDPQRNVSRRHLAVWVERDELLFRVLSVVNGVEMPFGEAPPGARGVLPAGQTLKVADYSLTAQPSEAADPPQRDPWAVFNRDNSGVGPVLRAAGAAAGHAPLEDDPFGDWGFETTFGPGPKGGDTVDAGKPEPANLAAFFQGLGLDAEMAGALNPGEIEAMGRLVRTLVLGVLDLHASAMGVKQDLRAEDRTMVAVKDNNPLKTDWPQEIKMRYLFGGHAGAVGFATPERAVRELLVDMVAHNSASGAAARSALESTLKEFAPDALSARLLGDGPKLLEATRAWHAYVKYYREQGADLSKWTRRLLDKYFAEAYLRESLRIRRETRPRKR